MNAIVKKLSLAGDKFMSGIHLKQPGFTYSACSCESFTKSKERKKNSRNRRFKIYLSK